MFIFEEIKPIKNDLKVFCLKDFQTSEIEATLTSLCPTDWRCFQHYVRLQLGRDVMISIFLLSAVGHKVHKPPMEIIHVEFFRF